MKSKGSKAKPVEIDDSQQVEMVDPQYHLLDPAVPDNEFCRALNYRAFQLFITMQEELSDKYINTDFPMREAWKEAIKEFKRRAILTRDPETYNANNNS